MSIIEKALEKKAGEKANRKAEKGNPLAVGAEMETPKPANKTSLFQEAPVALQSERYDLKIDMAVLEKNGMLLPDAAHSQLAEEYRLIKRPLLMNAFGEGKNKIQKANLILVTSSLPGEGKTFTALNLALSIATEREKTVLLIDADVAKSSISRLLGIEAKPGLIDLLENNAIRFSDVLLRTDIPNLTVLPAGRKHRHSTELLASDAMRRLAEEVSHRYADRIVIFDSPPLLAATQGDVLASLVGQVVMVIEADVTPQYIVQESIRKLEGCDIVGCVLNKMKKGLGSGYYAYHGYYGYYGR